MPTAKGKGGSTSHRYRPASEYDDATLAQKREYWRTKKREQRARLSERRRRPTQVEKLIHPNCSGSFLAISSLDESCGNTAEAGSVRATDGPKEKWLQTMDLNKASPQVPVSYSVSVRAAGGDTTTVKCPPARGAGIRVVTSPTAGVTQLNTSSVPPSRVTRITNGSSTKTCQPCVSMQGAFVPKTQTKAQVESRIQPKPSPLNVTTGRTLAPCPLMTNTKPLRGTNSALVTSQRAKGVFNTRQTSSETEEEKAAKRRENWRIKKREQRAKVAARLAKARERTPCTEVTLQRQTAQKTQPVGATGLQYVQTRTLSRRVVPNQSHAHISAPLTSVKKENNKLQSGAESLTTINLQGDQVKVHNPPVIEPEGIPARKFPSHVHLFNVSRGIARCKTPRQRFNDAQKTFMIQRNIRCKSPMLASFLGTRNIPKIDPNDTPEQIIAKRREYWRIKKREQRAKLSMEMKARLKEKDCVMRRVKRYQKILEDMRRARAQAAGGNTMTDASETIGGFIKEDGTVTINIPTNHSTADARKQQEQLLVTKPVLKPQNQTETKRRVIAPIRVNPPQVRVSFPLSGVNKTQRLMSVRPRTESTSVPIQTAGQLKLTHPQIPKNAGGSKAGSNLGGCVMKMAVTSLSAACQDPELTEEERMAKKREYWRVKKREQRAARAARLKQGLLQARALQRRKIQKQVNPEPPNRSLMSKTEEPLPGNSIPSTPNLSGIKQEAAVDLNSQPEQAICPDIKPPSSPSPPPAPQQEPDPALIADSQATTLLAVASMKKLLEESLSSVTECKREQSEVKVEGEDEESETKSNLTFLEKDLVAPISADLTLEIKSWQSSTDVLVQAQSPSLNLKNSPQTSETSPPNPVPNSTCESSSQTLSNFIVNPSMDASNIPSSPRRTQRICTKKVVHQNCCSPEPPKLHHLPLNQPEQQTCAVPESNQNNNVRTTQRTRDVVTAYGGLSSLQRKREYWKLMKRQQRARLKARQKDRAGESSSRIPQRNKEAPGAVIVNSFKGLNPPGKPAAASLTAVSNIPAVLVVSPVVCNSERSPDTLQVKLPVNRASCSEQRPLRPSPISPEDDKQTREWICRSTDVDSSPTLPTLKPPENPLTSINLQPIEPPPQTPVPTLSPIKIPSAHLQTPPQMTNKLSPISTLVPPKPIPGESDEDFLRRKREYWRIKKKEQRARKAIIEKRDPFTSRSRSTNSWRPILPAQELNTQDSSEWVNPEETQHLLSTSVEADASSFSYPNFTAPIEDESELAFMDYESSVEDIPVSDTVWRNRYLMDYDPLNQLLVCMVCGEQQYSHCVEGVRAHIDEAHPDTLNLDPAEHQRILEAWDEQVSQRERFFTSQLQRNSEATTETHNS
ncbi:uncharacterized protein si:dkey-28a3.2 [Cheilinus undulatus]|uniref:uncharacterized protein si:dkey-28a3.2 n=1 Tax=Cheilinus undulatus TaxID=241271 RepID=UPI001BD421A7|nr:uncharacterized protein si:dkey-28a3.2 [Cheilinus undulatus]